MTYNNILETTGNTPIVKINQLYSADYNVYIKIEQSNPAGSIKDRIALAMIEEAERQGAINKNTIIVEPTSGNTGVALAMIAAVKNYKLKLVMPESMTEERRSLMAIYGAEFILTPRELGMKGAIEKAQELKAKDPNVWIPSQFENPANPQIHSNTTAQEVLKDFPEGIDYLITGVGTGGHITGVGEILKKKFPKVKIIAVEPADSPVISGGEPGPHPIQGIGAGFIPENLNTKILDEVVQIEAADAQHYQKKLAIKEGIFGGVSTGASIAAVYKKLPDIPKGSTILTFNYDTGERYLTVM